jgi:hypothetical protein
MNEVNVDEVRIPVSRSETATLPYYSLYSANFIAIMFALNMIINSFFGENPSGSNASTYKSAYS